MPSISASPFKARRKALEPLSPKEGPKAPKLAESPYKPVKEPKTPPAEPEPAPVPTQVPTPRVAEKPPSATGPRDHSVPVSHQDKLTHTPEELEKKTESKQEQPEQPKTTSGHHAPATVEHATQLANTATEESFPHVADQLSLLPFDSLVELEYHLHGADPTTPTGRLLGVVRAMLDNVDDNQQLTQASYDAAARVVRGEKSLGTKAFEPLEFPVIEKKGEVKEDKRPVSLKVRRVNAFELRNRDKDWQEFGNFATHLQWEQIPEDEVWIADTVPDDELPLLIRNAEAQIWTHRHGANEDESYEYGLSVERAERERAKDIGGDRPYHNEVPNDVYRGLWVEINNKDQIYNLIGGRKK